MRHRVYGKHLGRNKDQRDNLFKGLVQALFTYGTIQVSPAKAKAIKGLVDKIINLAKDKKINQLRSFVPNKNLQDRLINDITPKLGAKTSGFTSTIRLGTRSGDQATIVRMSLIGVERLSVIGSRLSDKGQSVVSQPVTGKPKTGKPKSENRKQKTDNRKIKKTPSRKKK